MKLVLGVMVCVITTIGVIVNIFIIKDIVKTHTMSWNSASNVYEVCSDGQDCIQGSRDRGGGRFREGFKVGGRIKNGFTVSSEGFVQGGYSDY